MLVSNKAARRRTLPAAALVAIALGVAAAPPAVADEEIAGGLEYLNSCAPCHGVGGKGDGPVARHLNVKPTDLTTLAEQNDGVFPFLEVFQIVDGRTMVAGHGDRTMPIWGQRYREETGYADIPINRIATEALVRSRVLELVNYLQAIQDPQPESTLLGERTEGTAMPGADATGATPSPN